MILGLLSAGTVGCPMKVGGLGPTGGGKVDLRKLLHQVETASSGSPELDNEFVREQILNPHNFVGDR